jgi:hypothetical protein
LKLKRIIAGIAAGVGLLACGFWFGSASASVPDPGSVGDPLVSKSYVDQLVAKLADKGYIDERIAALASKSYVDERTAAAVSTLPDRAYVDGRLAFQVVNLPKGSALIAEAGTEVVLRGGKATAIVSQLGGLFDATGGTDVVQGEAVKANHLLVVPRADRRGLLATADAILMVKGNYSVIAAGQ